MTNIEMMAQCFFRGFKEKKLENIYWHIDNKTRIICGPSASLYTDGLGGACPAVLVEDRVVPSVRIEGKDVHDEGKQPHPKSRVWLMNWKALCRVGQDLTRSDENPYGRASAFAEALAAAAEDDVRSAILAVRNGRDEVERLLDVCRKWKVPPIDPELGA